MVPVLLTIQIIVYIIAPIWLYLWFTKSIRERFPGKSGLVCSIPDIHFLIKFWWAEWCLRAKTRSEPRVYEKEYRTLEYLKSQSESRKLIKDEDSSNSLFFYGADQKGNSVFVKFIRKARKIVEVYLQVALQDGRVYVLPGYPNTIYPSTSNQDWSAAGLKIEELDLHARWRIVYNGLLRNLSEGVEPSDENIQHVRLNFIYIANTRPLEWPADWSPKLHADALAREVWRSPQWINKIKLLDYSGLDHWGSLFGQVTFKDSSVSTLYLRGICQSRWGKHEFHEFHKTVSLYGVAQNGSMCYLGASNTKHSFSEIQFGHIRGANEKVCKPSWMDLDLNNFTNEKCVPNSGSAIRFTAEGVEYKVTLKFANSTTFYSGQPWKWVNQIINLKFEINGKTGFGVMQLCYPYTGECLEMPIVKPQYFKAANVNAQKTDYVLFFNDVKCQNESIVGGKGYSLATLSSIKDADFTVPQGFCVTVYAFELQLKSHRELQDLINNVQDICTRKKEGDVKQACENAMKAIESTPVAEPVKSAVEKAVEALETSSVANESIRYAIRSSAVGEDSEETSAAGQNSTYLGVKGKDNILKSIGKCWASLFSHQSVEYRRQHGLVVNASMGVCVQQMVNAEAAGVMFTRHPSTGDPSSIIITANFGLGETVVSAMVEPDSITVHRSWDNKLTVESSVVGNKTQKILVSDDGVATTELDEQESQKVSITEKIALRLAAIGVSLENLFGSARDVEWAVMGENIFLLQARPITTLYTWTDFEFSHELDSGVPSDADINTFANVGEVMPNPVAPLTLSTSTKIMEFAINRGRSEFDCIYLPIFTGRMMMNYYNTFLQMVGPEITISNKVTDIAISGRSIITPEIHKTAVERNGSITFWKALTVFYGMFKSSWTNSAVEKRAIELHNKFVLNADKFDTASSLYGEISTKLETLYDITLPHFHTSGVSVIYQTYAMSCLTSGYDDIIPQHITDIGLLLSSCSDIVSGEVPILFKKIAKCVTESGKAEEFNKLDPKDGVEWLKSNCPEATKHLNYFFENHGYRCIQEMDIASEPWCLQPDKVISTIQSISSSFNDKTVEPAAKALTGDELIARLSTPKTSTVKWLLRQLLPFCRKAVERREKTKSLLVHALYLFKLAYRRLATLMVSEGYIPSENLIFYLTHREIGAMLANPNVTFVQKAQRRMRVYAKLSKLQYPEMNFGVPMPIESTIDTTIRSDSTKLQGTSVCGGSILGRACVITDLSQTKQIQHGDILITHATDIGWTPYFPLLGGVVTELGGLISHGAVVAREYGLPCIVGAKGATNMFQTGDTVLLVGEMGVLELIQKFEG